jgi:glycerophosphoryl diester phosphodiesterase
LFDVTLAEEFLVFGHRGSPRRFPENTAASFDETLRAGADGFETDLRLLSDKTAVLYHDDDVGDDVCESLSSADFAQRKVVVDQLRTLERYAGRTNMILEVKRGKWEDLLIEIVAPWSNIVVASFDHNAIADLHRRNVAFDLGLTIHGSIAGLPSYAKSLGASWIFPAFRYVDAEMVAACHAESLRVVPWTPNRTGEWQRLREIGCDGIITDLPAEAVAWRTTA